MVGVSEGVKDYLGGDGNFTFNQPQGDYLLSYAHCLRFSTLLSAFLIAGSWIFSIALKAAAQRLNSSLVRSGTETRSVKITEERRREKIPVEKGIGKDYLLTCLFSLFCTIPELPKPAHEVQR